MKVLILMTATGQGHLAAAGAVAEDLAARGCEAVVSDVLGVSRKALSQHVSGTYSGLVNHAPALFGALYGMGALVSSPKRRSPIYYLNALNSKNLEDLLAFQKPDAIVCTHIFSAQTLTYLYRKQKTKIPSVAILTDYTCSPFWEETRLDRYVIPSPLLTEEFVHKGIPREKLVPAGIPVRNRFRNKTPRDAARAQLDLPARAAVFLCTGGSMGYGSLEKLCAALLRQCPGSTVLALCGHNGKLYERLCGIPGVRPYPYTDEIDLLMDAADVVLTKPGGLTATESGAKRTALVLTKPIPGGECRNAAFFARCGMAKTARTAGEAAAAACALARSPEMAADMRSAQEKYIPQSAGATIADLIIKTAKAGEHVWGEESCGSCHSAF